MKFILIERNSAILFTDVVSRRLYGSKGLVHLSDDVAGLIILQCPLCCVPLIARHPFSLSHTSMPFAVGFCMPKIPQRESASFSSRTNVFALKADADEPVVEQDAHDLVILRRLNRLSIVFESVSD